MGDLLNNQLREDTKSNGLIDSESDSIDARIARIDDQIEEESDRLDKRYETLAKQFVQLDSYMRKMESEQNYVSQIFSATDKKKS
jgi:flagellar hook-associated protein 2